MKIDYVLKNFHKLSHRYRLRISLSYLLHGKLPNITIEERERNDPRVSRWRESIYDRDNYTCQECGAKGVVLNAHHKNRWSEYPKLRFDFDNGVTLCKDCHSKTINFGRKNNAFQEG